MAGAVKGRLAALGFLAVHNNNEDCYQVLPSSASPPLPHPPRCKSPRPLRR